MNSSIASSTGVGIRVLKDSTSFSNHSRDGVKKTHPPPLREQSRSTRSLTVDTGVVSGAGGSMTPSQFSTLSVADGSTSLSSSFAVSTTKIGAKNQSTFDQSALIFVLLHELYNLGSDVRETQRELIQLRKKILKTEERHKKERERARLAKKRRCVFPDPSPEEDLEGEERETKETEEERKERQTPGVTLHFLQELCRTLHITCGFRKDRSGFRRDANVQKAEATFVEQLQAASDNQLHDLAEAGLASILDADLELLCEMSALAAAEENSSKTGAGKNESESADLSSPKQNWRTDDQLRQSDNQLHDSPRSLQSSPRHHGSSPSPSLSPKSSNLRRTQTAAMRLVQSVLHGDAHELQDALDSPPLSHQGSPATSPKNSNTPHYQSSTARSPTAAARNVALRSPAAKLLRQNSSKTTSKNSTTATTTGSKFSLVDAAPGSKTIVGFVKLVTVFRMCLEFCKGGVTEVALVGALSNFARAMGDRLRKFSASAVVLQHYLDVLEAQGSGSEDIVLMENDEKAKKTPTNSSAKETERFPPLPSPIHHPWQFSSEKDVVEQPTTTLQQHHSVKGRSTPTVTWTTSKDEHDATTVVDEQRRNDLPLPMQRSSSQLSNNRSSSGERSPTSGSVADADGGGQSPKSGGKRKKKQNTSRALGGTGFDSSTHLLTSSAFLAARAQISSINGCSLEDIDKQIVMLLFRCEQKMRDDVRDKVVLGHAMHPALGGSFPSAHLGGSGKGNAEHIGGDATPNIAQTMRGLTVQMQPEDLLRELGFVGSPDDRNTNTNNSVQGSRVSSAAGMPPRSVVSVSRAGQPQPPPVVSEPMLRLLPEEVLVPPPGSSNMVDVMVTPDGGADRRPSSSQQGAHQYDPAAGSAEVVSLRKKKSSFALSRNNKSQQPTAESDPLGATVDSDDDDDDNDGRSNVLKDLEQTSQLVVVHMRFAKYWSTMLKHAALFIREEYNRVVEEKEREDAAGGKLLLAASNKEETNEDQKQKKHEALSNATAMGSVGGAVGSGSGDGVGPGVVVPTALHEQHPSPIQAAQAAGIPVPRWIYNLSRQTKEIEEMQRSRRKLNTPFETRDQKSHDEAVGKKRLEEELRLKKVANIRYEQQHGKGSYVSPARHQGGVRSMLQQNVDSPLPYASSQKKDEGAEDDDGHVTPMLHLLLPRLKQEAVDRGTQVQTEFPEGMGTSILPQHLHHLPHQTEKEIDPAFTPQKNVLEIQNDIRTSEEVYLDALATNNNKKPQRQQRQPAAQSSGRSSGSGHDRIRLRNALLLREDMHKSRGSTPETPGRTTPSVSKKKRQQQHQTTITTQKRKPAKEIAPALLAHHTQQHASSTGDRRAARFAAIMARVEEEQQLMEQTGLPSRAEGNQIPDDSSSRLMIQRHRETSASSRHSKRSTSSPLLILESPSGDFRDAVDGSGWSAAQSRSSSAAVPRRVVSTPLGRKRLRGKDASRPPTAELALTMPVDEVTAVVEGLLVDQHLPAPNHQDDIEASTGEQDAAAVTMTKAKSPSAKNRKKKGAVDSPRSKQRTPRSAKTPRTPKRGGSAATSPTSKKQPTTLIGRTNSPGKKKQADDDEEDNQELLMALDDADTFARAEEKKKKLHTGKKPHLLTAGDGNNKEASSPRAPTPRDLRLLQEEHEERLRQQAEMEATVMSLSHDLSATAGGADSVAKDLGASLGGPSSPAHVMDWMAKTMLPPEARSPTNTSQPGVSPMAASGEGIPSGSNSPTAANKWMNRIRRRTMEAKLASAAGEMEVLADLQEAYRRIGGAHGDGDRQDVDLLHHQDDQQNNNQPYATSSFTMRQQLEDKEDMALVAAVLNQQARQDSWDLWSRRRILPPTASVQSATVTTCVPLALTNQQKQFRKGLPDDHHTKSALRTRPVSREADVAKKITKSRAKQKVTTPRHRLFSTSPRPASQRSLRTLDSARGGGKKNPRKELRSTSSSSSQRQRLGSSSEEKSIDNDSGLLGVPAGGSDDHTTIPSDYKLPTAILMKSQEDLQRDNPSRRSSSMLDDEPKSPASPPSSHSTMKPLHGGGGGVGTPKTNSQRSPGEASTFGMRMVSDLGSMMESHHLGSHSHQRSVSGGEDDIDWGVENNNNHRHHNFSDSHRQPSRDPPRAPVVRTTITNRNLSADVVAKHHSLRRRFAQSPLFKDRVKEVEEQKRKDLELERMMLTNNSITEEWDDDVVRDRRPPSTIERERNVQRLLELKRSRVMPPTTGGFRGAQKVTKHGCPPQRGSQR